MKRLNFQTTVEVTDEDFDDLALAWRDDKDTFAKLLGHVMPADCQLRGSDYGRLMRRANRLRPFTAPKSWVPGLIVKERWFDDRKFGGAYEVYHERSNMNLGYLWHDPAAVSCFLRAAADLADWTLSAEELRQIDGLNEQTRGAAKRNGGVRS